MNRYRIDYPMQKIFLIISLFCISHSWAQTKTTNDSKKEEGYNDVLQEYISKFNETTSDNEQLYSDVEEKQLDKIIRDFEKETTIQIRIVTIDRKKTSLEDFEMLSLHIAQAWGIEKKNRGNGILIAISLGLRSIRIQNGKEIERMISNEETNKIMDDYFITEFKKGNYYKGTFDGVNALMDLLKTKINK